MPPAAPSFPSCRKRRGRKGALGYSWVRSASEFRQEPMFRVSFHTVVTLRASDCAPPDTGVSDLQLVAFEYLQSIEGAGRICWSAPFCGEVIFICFALCRGGALPRPYRMHPKGSPCRGRHWDSRMSEPSPMRGRWRGGAVTDAVGQSVLCSRNAICAL